ncbi:uncharacterized protein LOC132039486 [Lycium ferocissimum]|uniref:uncharacterized protein LOC132039486 n=1 Tax=Lycium ferocissimum TaxID=112874 RepID=UPI0028160320|nr:uncharacterized protein LOC132039486 [Lycium ferocissimum]
MAMEEEVAEPYSGWRLFFDGAVNYKGSGIGAVLISETGQHYPMAAKLNFRCTNNMAEYEACILGLRMALDMNIQELLRLCERFKSIDFRHTPRAQNEFADALATIASMIQHSVSTHIDPLEITLREEHAHCAHVEAEPDGQPWYADIKAYLEKREYPPESSANQKKTIRRLANGFFLNKEVLYKRTPDLGLLRFFFYRTADTPPTGLLTAKAEGKTQPSGERPKGSRQKIGNKDTSGRKGRRANERKDESDQKGHTKGEQQKISDQEGHN